MLCSNCGKDIPFSGKVCPYCQSKKRKDQQFNILIVSLGIIGGFIGFLLFEAEGAVGGFILGGFSALFVSLPNDLKDAVAEAKASNTGSNTDDRNQAVEDRMSKLKRLREQELITEEEYQTKKAKILSEV